MDKDTERHLGFILGQVYRLQKRVEDKMCPVSDGHIYGLLHGFEEVLDRQREMMGSVSQSDVRKMMDILDTIANDPERMRTFKDRYELERPLKEAGIYEKSSVILKYLWAEHRYRPVIELMDQDSHGHFDLDEQER